MRSTGRIGESAGHVLGRKLDSIPFSPYHLMIIAVLSLVGFVDGYDLVMTGSLLVLAKEPLHMTPGEVRLLAVASTMMIVVGGFMCSAISDHFSRKTIMIIGTAGITFFTLLIPLVQTGEQLIALRLLTGLAGGFAVSAPFPIAAELMPAQHRRTYGAVYEMSLAAAFTVLPLVGALLAGNTHAFRWMALPGGLAFLIVPAVIYLLIPESPRWYLRRGRAADAVDTVNHIVRRGGNRVPTLSLAALGDNLQIKREPLPPYRALWARGQLRWTLVGISSYVFAGTAFFLISVLLPKALVDQGGAVATSFGVATLVFMASIPGKGFTGYLMEIIGRRWIIGCYCLPNLPIRAVSDGAARARSYLRRIGRPDILRGVGTIPDGAACRLGTDLLRHDLGGRDDRRFRPVDLRSRDRGSARNSQRNRGGAGLTRGSASLGKEKGARRCDAFATPFSKS